MALALASGVFNAASKVKPSQWKEMKGAMNAAKEVGQGGFKGILDMIMNLKIFDMILKPISALMKVFLNSVMQPLYPLFKQIGDAIIKFMPFVQKLGEMLGQVIAKILEKLIPIVVQLMEELGPPLFEILILLADLIVELLPLLDILFELAKIVMDLDKEFGLMKYLMIGIHIVAKALSIAIKFVSKWVKTVVDLFFGHSPGLIPGFEAIAKIVQTVVDMIYKQFLKVIDLVIVVVKEVTKVIEVITNFIKDTLMAILQFLQDSLETLGEIIDTLVSGAITILQTILESLDELISKLADSINSLVRIITDNLIKILETLKSIIEAVATVINNLVNSITNGLIAVFASVEDVMDSFTAFLIELRGLLKDISSIGIGGGGGGGGGNDEDEGEWWEFWKGASGGIVNKPTKAIIGEAGAEAVIPLDRMGTIGGTTINIHLEGAVITDEYAMDELAHKIGLKIWERLE